MNYLNLEEAKEKLQPALKEILEAELKAGNTFKEACTGWPDDETLQVFLRKPFKTPIRKDIPGVEYREVNDPHYWKSEYWDEGNRQMVADNF